MLVTLAAALSLASSLTIEVPFVPQTDALCGGAAAAMVFRYWGDAHADPQQFASLVERHGRVSGIADDVLVRAIDTRGWRTERLLPSDVAQNSLDGLRARIAARQPVIVLLADRGAQYHYVVVIGVGDDAIVVNDPSWGPSHRMTVRRFTELWNASRNWGLVILPSERTTPSGRAATSGPADPGTAADSAGPSPVDPCEASVTRAVEEVQRRGLSHGDDVLEPLRARCSESPALMREIAGLRFAQKRWTESEAAARTVLARVPGDSYASEVLGAARYMQDDPVGALRAWNTIQKPRLDLVRISGLTRSRYQAIVDAIGLQSGVLLTPDAFVQAQHRIDELPDRSSSRLSLRPGEDGFASVDVAIAERSGLPRSYPEWAAFGVRAAVERDAAVTVPGFTGQGETWSAEWRWWSNRPRVAVGFAAPRPAGLPGVWRVDGSWEAETYAVASAQLRESRTHGGVTVSDWVGPSVRYSMSGGFDSWNTGRLAASLGGTLERRLFADRVAIAGDATTWVPMGSGRLNGRFNTIGVRAHARTVSPRAWAYTSTAERRASAMPLRFQSGAAQAKDALVRFCSARIHSSTTA